MSKGAYRLEIGEYQCIICNDGVLYAKEAGYPDVFGLNCIYIASGNRKILVDTGNGKELQSTTGQLVANLEAECIKREAIDTIIFTHGHIDHAGGACDAGGKPVFPNARYLVARREWDYWTTPPGSNKLHNFFLEPARRYLLPLKDRFELLDDNYEVLPGIRMIAAPGHTPGNAMIDISSRGKRLLCIGDIIHAPREFIDPRYLAAFDVDPEKAVKTRAEIFSQVVREGTFVFACHLAFPGLGYIKQSQGVLSWMPI